MAGVYCSVCGKWVDKSELDSGRLNPVCMRCSAEGHRPGEKPLLNTIAEGLFNLAVGVGKGVARSNQLDQMKTREVRELAEQMFGAGYPQWKTKQQMIDDIIAAEEGQ